MLFYDALQMCKYVDDNRENKRTNYKKKKSMKPHKMYTDECVYAYNHYQNLINIYVE